MKVTAEERRPGCRACTPEPVWPAGRRRLTFGQWPGGGRRSGALWALIECDRLELPVPWRACRPGRWTWILRGSRGGAEVGGGAEGEWQGEGRS